MEKSNLHSDPQEKISIGPLEKDGEKITVPFEQIAKAKFIHI